MPLKRVCPACSKETIALRLVGKYIGNGGKIHIWQCRLCEHLWV